MAELPRYKPARPTPQTGGGMAQRAKAQMFGTLSDRIDQFAGMALDRYTKETEVEAKQDAAEAFSKRGMQAKINDDMTVYGQTYSNALTNMHKKQLAIDTGVKLEETYNKFKNNPLAFKEATDEMYNKTSELLPQHLKAEYAIDFEANKAHYAGEVNNNRIKLDKQRDLALTNELLLLSTQNASKASREGNHDLALYEIDKGIKALDSSLEAITITAEQHRKGIADIKFASSTAMFKGINDNHINDGDLQGSQDYIESFRTSDVEGYTDAQREKLADDMQGDLNKQIKLNKITSDAGKAEATIAIKDAKKILDSGKEPENYNLVKESLGLVSPTLQHEFNVSEQAYKIMQKVDVYSLPEQQAIVNKLEADPKADRVDIEALAQAKKNLSEKMRKAEKDPYSLGVEDGLYEQAGVLLPSQGPEALAQFLPTRAKQSRMTQLAYGTAPKLFTDSEAQQFSAWLEAPDTSISQKLDFIEAVELLVSNESSLVYNQLMEKGSSVFAFAGSMVKKGDRQKAEKMLRGQMILREQPNVVPMDIMQWKFNGEVGNAMRYQGAGMRKALIDGTTSYYAAIAEEQGELSKADAPISLVKQAVKEVTGGVGMKNDQNYFLPPQATQDDVDDWLDELEPSDFEEVGGITSEQAVLVTQRGQIVSVGEGKYRLVYQGGILKQKDGTPLILEYSK